jgi:Spy/CpxP family protein refolding chaperone
MRASRLLMAGLFVVSTVMVVSAQPGGFGGGKGKISVSSQVATNVALQEELKVTDAQKAKLKVISDAAKKRGEAFKEAAGDKEKLKELFSGFAKDAEEANKVISETLTAEQKARVKQIDRQVAGVRAFGNDELVADLKLSDTQKTKVKGIVDEFNKDSMGLGGFGGFGKGGFDKEKAAEAAKKREKLEKGAMADIDEVLNDQQKTTWKDLTGAPFDRSKLQFGFGGGGFGGGFGNKGKGKKTD